MQATINRLAAFVKNRRDANLIGSVTAKIDNLQTPTGNYRSGFNYHPEVPSCGKLEKNSDSDRYLSPRPLY